MSYVKLTSWGWMSFRDGYQIAVGVGTPLPFDVDGLTRGERRLWRIRGIFIYVVH